MICARCCSKRRRDFGFIVSGLREAFVSSIRVDITEQASGSFMTGMRAFSAHPSHLSFVALYCSSSINTNINTFR